MKFKIQREVFLQPLSQVVGVVERRQTLPVLANFLLVARDGQVSVTGTDMEVELVGSVATDMAQEVIDEAVQIFGGLGVTVGQKVEELYREIRAMRIYEGTSEVQKLVIAGQTMAAHEAEAR